MNFNDLNDDCIRVIFLEFTLAEQLRRLRGVCQRWNLLVGEKCATKRTLKLFDSLNSVYDFSWNVYSDRREADLSLGSVGSDDDLIIKIRKPNDEHLVAQFLAQQFPSVRHLVICFATYPNYYSHAPELLRAMPHLTGLVLFGKFPYSSFEKNRIFSQINSLASLTVFENFTNKPGKLWLPNVLPNLEILSLASNFWDIADILSKTSVEKLTKLNLENINYPQLQSLLYRVPKFGQNITHLNLANLNLATLQLICRHFRAIRWFEIGFVSCLQ